jgi:hypothetical protein
MPKDNKHNTNTSLRFLVVNVHVCSIEKIKNKYLLHYLRTHTHTELCDP